MPTRFRNAMRFLTEGRADAVKLEVDGDWTPLVAKLSRAGIPVVAHLGSRPQCAKQEGGYRSAGRTAEVLQAIVDDAIAMEAAGRKTAPARSGAQRSLHCRG